MNDHPTSASTPSTPNPLSPSARPWLAAMLSLALLPGCVAVAPGDDGEAQGGVATVPLQEWGGRPVVPVTVNGRGPFPFILDTGAAVSVIDLGLREELAPTVIGSTPIGSPMGTPAETEELSLASLVLGAEEVNDVRCVALDLEAMFVEAGAPRGVLSTRAFAGHTLTFDFPHRSLTMARGTLPPADGRTIFDIEDDDGPPALAVRVGTSEMRAHLDTGAPGGLSLPLAGAEGLRLASPPEEVGRARLVDATVAVYSARLDGVLRIGDYRFESPAVEFLDSERARPHIGMRLLRDFALTIDHSGGRVRLERGGAAVARGVPAEQAAGSPRRLVVGDGGRKRYGMRFAGLAGPEMTVLGVDPGSPAAIGGVRSGDVIEALNGSPVAELDGAARVDALRGSPLEVTVRRNGRERRFTLSLE